jgi:hypothetical protein
MRKGSFRVFWLIFLSGLVLMGLLTSCARSPYSLDQGRAAEKTISAKKGGEIGLKTASGERVNLAIPQQALKKDTTIVATPLTEAPLSDQKDILVKGVLLEEKGKEGKSLNFKFPVLLSFTVKGTLPEEATIVKYLPEKKSYEVIPTEITTKGKETTLTAELMSLSGYGGRRGSQREIRRARERQRERGVSWGISVSGTKEKTIYPMKHNFTLSFFAENLSSDIAGSYHGLASLQYKVTAVGLPLGAGAVATGDASGTVHIKIIRLGSREGAYSYLGEGRMELVNTGGELKVWVPKLGERDFTTAGSVTVWMDITISGSAVKVVIVRSREPLTGMVFNGKLIRGKM